MGQGPDADTVSGPWPLSWPLSSAHRGHGRRSVAPAPGSGYERV